MRKFCSILILCSFFLIQNPIFAIQRTDISVIQNQIPLKSRLKKEYTGHEYKITNESKSTINIVNAQIINGVDGSVGYNAVEEGGGKSVGILWAVCGPVGLFTLGIGWVAGLIGTPIAWIIGNNKDKKARKESIPYSNIVPLGNIGKMESVSVMSLVPIGSKPQLKLSIYDEKTKDYQSFIY